MVGNLSHNRADNREFVRDPGRFREVVAEDLPGICLHDTKRTAVFQRRFGLGVERLMLREAAAEIQLDHALDALWQLPIGRCGREGRVLIQFARSGPQPQKVPQAEAECSQASDLQHGPPR